MVFSANVEGPSDIPENVRVFEGDVLKVERVCVSVTDSWELGGEEVTYEATAVRFDSKTYIAEGDVLDPHCDSIEAIAAAIDAGIFTLAQY